MQRALISGLEGDSEQLASEGRSAEGDWSVGRTFYAWWGSAIMESCRWLLEMGRWWDMALGDEMSR